MVGQETTMIFAASPGGEMSSHVRKLLIHRKNMTGEREERRQ
jgi:hypothetical protein